MYASISLITYFSERKAYVANNSLCRHTYNQGH